MHLFILRVPKHFLGTDTLAHYSYADRLVLKTTPSIEFVHHFDRGARYTSDDYRHLLQERHIECKISGKANCTATLLHWRHSYRITLMLFVGRMGVEQLYNFVNQALGRLRE